MRHLILVAAFLLCCGWTLRQSPPGKIAVVNGRAQRAYTVTTNTLVTTNVNVAASPGPESLIPDCSGTYKMGPVNATYGGNYWTNAVSTNFFMMFSSTEDEYWYLVDSDAGWAGGWKAKDWSIGGPHYDLDENDPTGLYRADVDVRGNATASWLNTTNYSYTTNWR